MEEIILNLLIASGIIGIVSNYLVSLTKYVREVYKIEFSPRIMNAVYSLSGALGAVMSGGEVDMTNVETSMAVLLTASVAWLVGHVTHRVNSI